MAWITVGLIAANLLVFLLWEPSFGSQGQQEDFFFCHAEIPYEISHQTNLADGGTEAARALAAGFDRTVSEAQRFQAFLASKCGHKSWLSSVFVSMFLHAGWLHIGGNMLFLWVFGNNVEDRLGKPLFLVFYLLGGVAATALQVALAPSAVVPTLGASGAVAAILGAYAVMYPRARVTTLVFFFLITVIELPALAVLGAWFVLQLFSGVGQLGTNVNGGVAYWAHIGGFAAGALIAFLFFRPRPAPQARVDIGPFQPPSSGV